MAGSFGGTVKLTGESEYKKALSEITSNLKVLNSEMKTVTSQYDRADKSEENLSQQNEVLNKKLEEQKKKVGLLSEQLEKSKKETGDNSETTKKWQTQLNNAQAELNKTEKSLKDNTEALKKEDSTLDNAKKSTKEFGESTEDAGQKSLKMSDIIKANVISQAIVGGFKALANAIKGVANSMKESMANATAYADEILTMSQTTGMSTEALQKYHAVAELTDVSMETLTGTMKKNIMSMNSGKDAYNQLGVSVKDSSGKLRDSDTVYWETIDALSKVKNETERNALAMQIFGKNAQALNPIINMGSEGVKNLQNNLMMLGATMTEEDLEALGKLDDQMQIFKIVTENTSNLLSSMFAPALTDIMENVNQLVGAFNGLISAIKGGDQEGIKVATQTFNDALDNMVSSAGEMLWSILDVFSTILTSIVGVIVQHFPEIASKGLEIAMTLAKSLIDSLPRIIEIGVQTILALIQGLTQSLPQLVPVIFNGVLLMVNTLLENIDLIINAGLDLVFDLAMALVDNIDLIIDAGIELVIGLAKGLINAIPKLIEKIPILITKLIDAITRNLPKIIEMGITLVVKLAVGLIKAIPQLIKSIPQIITAIVKGLASGVVVMAKVGLDLIKGLWNGIKDAGAWLWSKVKGFFSSLTDKIKNFFGIHSPSTLFRDEIGNNLALGLGEGFQDTMKDVTNDMANSIPTEFDTSINANINGGASSGFSYTSMVSAFKEALTEMKVEMDDREMGRFVTKTVERQVFA